MIKPFISKIKWALMGALAITIVGCADDNDEPNDPEVEEVGTYIVNEGEFLKGTGSISVFNEESGAFSPDGFSASNGRTLLATAISVTSTDDYVIIATNSGDKIEICDANLTTLTDPVTLPVPRYSAVEGDIAYVTCWGSFTENFQLPDSKLFKVDLTTGTKLDSVDCGDGAEDIMIINNELFVANSYSNTIEVYNTDLELTNTIEFGAFESPKQLELSEDGTLWTTTSFGLSAINPSSKVITKSVAISNMDFYGKFDIGHNSDNIYVIAADPWGTENPKTYIQIYDIEADEVSTFLETTGTFYGVGCHPENGHIYVGKIVDFTQNGTLDIYATADSLLTSKVVGLGPTGFVFY